MKLPMFMSEGEATLVLLHGRGADHRTWAGFALALTEHRVITVDLVGHGIADAPGGEEHYTITAQARDVWETLEHFPKPLSIMGHSMGGMVALEMAMTKPQHVSNLILASTSARPPSASESRSQVQAIYEGLARLARERGMAAVCAAYESQLAPLDDTGRQMLLNFKPQAFAASIFAAKSMEDYEARLSGLSVPSLVMVGERDEVFVNEAKRMVERLPKSGLCIVPDAGHGIYHEQPQLVSQRILQFMRRQVT